MVRIAIVDRERCKPKDCQKECYRFCPVARMGEEVITFDPDTGQAVISEKLCQGTALCTKKCPFKAIKIINLPGELEENLTHRYGPNAFKLYRLPIPKPEKVTGLIGPNGVGKTTAMKILAGEIKPNLGNYENPPDWSTIIKHYRGSELQPYFEKMSSGELRIVHKPQNITRLPEVVKGVVGELLERVDERGVIRKIAEELELKDIWDRELKVLSGGELQRVAIAAAVARDADVYLFDEPSSYEDIYQRLNIARVIRRLADEKKTVICVEHDLALVDYLSDAVCMFYGNPGAYGVVSNPHGVREGINIYLAGFLPDENLRFRAEPIRFHTSPTPSAGWKGREVLLSFGEMRKSYDGFSLKVEGGEIHRGEVIGIIGPNGIGKTTFIKLLAGEIQPDEGEPPKKDIKVSYKPQYLKSNYDGTVEMLLRETGGKRAESSTFKSDVIKPLELEGLLDRPVNELSGGELQSAAIAACLSRSADIYLLDEPSAFLSSEQRLIMARTVRRVIESWQVAAFVVEHDIIGVDSLSDSLMVFSGIPGVKGEAKAPTDLRTGMNQFLKALNITFRRDPENGRPRINKEDSRLDKLQKEQGEYYYVPVGKE
ncbi:MAG: ribosome biogenesis/translation initiation ATPase RLI [Candidatus Jordarchaeaceae archaeon]